MAEDRILWNNRPVDVGDAGSVDEIVAYPRVADDIA